MQPGPLQRAALDATREAEGDTLSLTGHVHRGVRLEDLESFLRRLMPSRTPTYYSRPMHPTARKVGERLAKKGLVVEIVDLPDSTRTAADAARAVECEIGQIVKSLVFVGQDGAVICLCAGDHRVKEGELAGDARRATASEVREATGFAIGGVPPLGHDQTLPTIVDSSLQRFETVWCAAGTPNAVFSVVLAQLVQTMPDARLSAEAFEPIP